MEYISVFDILKIGVGPSSSHTLGPWRAAEKWLENLSSSDLEAIDTITVNLYGSLSLTGKGHATDLALMLGLSGSDPENATAEEIQNTVSEINSGTTISLQGVKSIDFDPKEHITFNSKFLPFHANGITFSAFSKGKLLSEETYYSIGGGFIIQENHKEDAVELQNAAVYPFPIQNAQELANYCKAENKSISEIVLANERVLRPEAEIKSELDRIWEVMLASVYEGCHTSGELPGGLKVKRRASDLRKSLLEDSNYSTPEEWVSILRNSTVKFRQILKWVSCFAIAVNEVNAAFGRVVTAPTNGSAGVIPAVLMYYLSIENHEAGKDEVRQFLLVAGELGSIFKKGSTISAAMGGCQAEIGVSSAMAAGALTELLGGTPEQVMIAAEIAMEHHLGLTCDPIAGLVQIPCIERNTMGAIKAINAAELALDTDPKDVKVPLDDVINTMWETAKDMNHKYKETSQGGLAVKVSLADC